MNIDQLRNFVLIHRVGSINKASEQAHISPQALNISMKKLEDEIGCQLFVRHARGAFLSEEGLIFEKVVEEILYKLDNIPIGNNGGGAAILNQETLSVFFSPAVGNTFIPAIQKIFHSKKESTKLILMEKETDEILDMITEEAHNAVGIIATLGELPALPENCTLFPIFDDKILCTVISTHPLAKQKSVSMRTILKYPLAIYQGSHSSSNPVCNLIEQYGLPDYRTVTNNLMVYQNAILNQNAVGFINKSAVQNHTALPDIIDDIVALPIRNIPNLKVYLVSMNCYLKEHKDSVQELVDIYKSLL